MSGVGRRLRAAFYTGVFLFLCLLLPREVDAYVGPGAGFAFVSSFFILLVSFLAAFLALLTWPFRWFIGWLRSRKALGRARVRKVIVLGLDGQDPELTERFMQEGVLPNFKSLKEQGSYHRLATTLPAESPVAWSSFQTGSNPGRHRVFDFFVPNRKSYLPELASAEIKSPLRGLNLGPYRIPLGKPLLSLKRKSRAFWKTLGDHGVFSTILRVPITFPPEKFRGLLLAAMSVPDLNGTQGTFTYYTSDQSEVNRIQGGVVSHVSMRDGACRASIQGPENPLRRERRGMTVPFQLIPSTSESVDLRVSGEVFRIQKNEFSPWIRVTFKAGLGMKVHGLVRFYLKAVTPHVRLYMSPINIDPQRPALPISHPFAYGVYLAKTLGNYSTLGLAEDTWALNERVLDEEAFLKQAYLIHDEREAMFFDAVDKTSRGAVVCVFDITDRLQHMFWRYLQPDHPSNADKDVEKHRETIKVLYQRMDDLVGRTLEKVDDDTILLVMSDHGFKSFQRGVSINAWFHQNGFLALKGETGSAEWFRDVDWSGTRAYAMGLGGIYLNVAGRDAQGIVEPDEIASVKRKIAQGLLELYDEERGMSPVKQVYDTRLAYSGPYVGEAPDLIVGFRPGYRVSWNSAMGITDKQIFEDNTKAWSGDHCVNPPDVPGILFCNREIEVQHPNIMDIAPTILDLFGVPLPAYVDGVSLMPEKGRRSGKDGTNRSEGQFFS